MLEAKLFRLIFDYLLEFVKRDGTELIAINSYIVLFVEQVFSECAELWDIACVQVSEELPRSTKRALPVEHRVVAQNDVCVSGSCLVLDPDVKQVVYFQKEAGEKLVGVIVVVVAADQDFCSVQLSEYFTHPFGWCKSDVAQYEDQPVFRNSVVPVSDKVFVHFNAVAKWPSGKLNNAIVSEVQIGSEEYVPGGCVDSFHASSFVDFCMQKYK